MNEPPDEFGHEPAPRLRASASQRVAQLLGVGQVDLARRLVAEAIAADPEDPGAHAALGLVLVAAKEPAAALDAVREALRRDPVSTFAHFVGAKASQALGRWAEAERSLRTVLEIDPSADYAAAEYAFLLSRLDRDREALAWIEHALSLDPDDAHYHAARAHLLLIVPSSSWSMSEESARAALRIDPRNNDAEAVLGYVLLREHRWEEAETHFRSVLSREPYHGLAFNGLSELTMASSPLYAPLLMLSLALARLSPEGRLMAVFGAWALYRGGSSALRAGQFDLAADVFWWVYLGFCLWTWFAQPITHTLLSWRHPWLRGG